MTLLLQEFNYLLLLKHFPGLPAHMRNLIYDLEVVFSICTKFAFMCFLYFSLHNHLLQHIMLKISFVLSQSGLTQSVFLTSHKIATLHPWFSFQQLFHRNELFMNTADKSYVEHPRRGCPMMFHFYSYCVIWHTPEKYVLFKALAVGGSQEAKEDKRLLL